MLWNTKMGVSSHTSDESSVNAARIAGLAAALGEQDRVGERYGVTGLHSLAGDNCGYETSQIRTSVTLEYTPKTSRIDCEGDLGAD